MFFNSKAVCVLLILSLFHKASSVPKIVLSTHSYDRNSGSRDGGLVNGTDRYVLIFVVTRPTADAASYPENRFTVNVLEAGQLTAVPIMGCTPSLQNCSSSNQGCSCTQMVSDTNGNTYDVVVNTTANIKDSGGTFIAQWQSAFLTGTLIKTEFNLPDVCNQKKATYKSGSNTAQDLSATGNNTVQISKDEKNTNLMFCVENLESTIALTIQLDGTNRTQGTTSCVDTTVEQADVGKVFTLAFTESTTEPGCGRQGSFTLVYEAVDTGSDSESDTGEIVGITCGVIVGVVLCCGCGIVVLAKCGPSLTPTPGSRKVTRKLRFFHVEKTSLIITTKDGIPNTVDWSEENGKYVLKEKSEGIYDIEESPDKHKKEEEPVTSLDMTCLPAQTSVKMVVTYVRLPSTWSTKEVKLPCASATNKDTTATRLEPINNDMKTNGTEKNNKSKSCNNSRDAAGDKTDGLKEVEDGMEMSRVGDGGVGAAAMTNEVMKENETKKKKKKRNRTKKHEGEELPPLVNAPHVPSPNNVETVSPRPLPTPSGSGGVNTSVTGLNGISSRFSPQQSGRNRPTSIEVTRQGNNW